MSFDEAILNGLVRIESHCKCFRQEFDKTHFLRLLEQAALLTCSGFESAIRIKTDEIIQEINDKYNHKK